MRFRALDRISAAQWLDREGFDAPRLRWLVDYACRDDYGLRASETSAWAMVFYWASRTPPGDSETVDVLTWPEGNGALVAHLHASARRSGVTFETNTLVSDIRADGADVELAISGAGGEGARRVVADRVIVALPRFVARRVVRGLEERDAARHASFEYGAWAVANVHLSERPLARGVGLAWDNVIYGSPSLGYVTATHQRGRDVGPTVWTHYWPLATAQAAEGRRTPLRARRTRRGATRSSRICEVRIRIFSTTRAAWMSFAGATR